MINRRHALALGLAVPGAAALASCGPNAGGGGAEEGSGSSAIRLAWWGNPTRDEMTEQVVEAYAERSEEHTSELQSRGHLVCRLLLEKKKNKNKSLPADDMN